MKNKYISIIIISIFLFLSLSTNLYLYNSFNKLKIINELKIVNDLNHTDNKWYRIHSSSLFIDYPEFILNSDKYVSDILSRYDWFNPEAIFIKNINWNDFSFLSEITSQIYFRYYGFDFYKYNDDDNIIFDSINKRSWPSNINISFYTELDWENTLINTFSKINDVIDEIVHNNSALDKSNNKIGWLTISWFDTFLDTYYLSKDELEIISNMKIDTFLFRLKIREGSLSDEYMIDYLNNTKINYFSSFFMKYTKFYWEVGLTWEVGRWDD